jgi:hypothetical protein
VAGNLIPPRVAALPRVGKGSPKDFLNQGEQFSQNLTRGWSASISNMFPQTGANRITKTL